MAATSAPAGLPTRTTAAGRAGANRPVLHPRLVAVATAVSCGAHLWLALSGHHGVWLGLLMVALAGVCVPCTVHIWRHCRLGDLHQVAAAAVAMAALHAVLLLGGGAGHAHGGAPPSSAAAEAGGTQLLLVIALELATALLAAMLVARLRRLPV